MGDTYLSWETGARRAGSWKDNLVRIHAFTLSAYLVDTKYRVNLYVS
ncbi:hypothetical protein pEaSNUABM5_00121 [Erwinia phage pEa_SNUABM_5]|uniref:Uncharacterized protein n=1 Tax=Erwinia phage pEa_SNUABM_5 TaxID=2797313 RepID=A0A7T8EPG3_9CAUD|nr:hypothetical protein MPK73_gp121 [Erwinia phage pEa_SNUABM_5]QQO90263.1 hypothetical protein pEaSNUABM5_00121 [Erwinia phage pEa_SNUABM_5]